MKSIIRHISIVCSLFIISLFVSVTSSFAGIEPSKGIEIFDSDRNGKVDKALMWFTSPIDPASVNQNIKNDFKVYSDKHDYLIQSIGLNLDNDGDGIPDGNDVLTLILNEGDDYDTGNILQVTYEKRFGDILRYSTGDNVVIRVIDAFEVDKAAPIFIRGTIKDIDNNGIYDEFWSFFSEQVYSENPLYGFEIYNSPYSFDYNQYSFDGNILKLKVIETIPHFGDILHLSYESAPIGEVGSPSTDLNSSGIGDLHDYAKNSLGALEPNYFYINKRGIGDEIIPDSLLFCDHIRIISPNGGEKLARENTLNITWESINTTNVKIEYSIDNGLTWATIVSDIFAYVESYLWTVPDTPSDSCLVKITDTSDLFKSDESFKTFSIIAPGIKISTNTLAFGKVKVNSSEKKSFTIENTGTSELVVSDIYSSDVKFNVEPPYFILQPGSSKIVTVTFSSTQIDFYIAIITITCNVTGKEESEVKAHVEVVPFLIIVKPKSLEFGSVEADSTKAETFTITNYRTSDFVVNKMTKTKEAFTIDPTPFTIPPDSIKVVTVKFSPQTSGLQNDMIEIVGEGFQDTVTVSGTGVAPEIDVSPLSIDIGDVEVFCSSSDSITITNIGTSVLDISKIHSPSGKFVVDPSLLTLPPDSSQVVTVTFSPTTIGPDSTTITVTSNDRNKSNLPISVRGKGIPPKLTVSDSSLSFEDVEIGSSGLASFTITNEGNVNPIVSKITSDNSVFTVEPDSVSLKPDQNETIVVKFSPPDTGDYSAEIAVTNNGIEKGKLKVEATGKGIPPKLTVSDSSLSFEDVEIGSSGLASFTITNEGNVNPIVSKITSDNGVFTVEPDSVSLKPGMSKKIDVKFTPVDTIFYSTDNTVTIYDFENNVLTVSATGTGVAPIINVSPQFIDFGDVARNDSSKVDITISNEIGTSKLIISSITSYNDYFKVNKEHPTIPPGHEEMVTVTFYPKDITGNQSGIITILSNAYNSKSDTVEVKGRSVIPIIKISDSLLDFGEAVAQIDSVLKSLTITNEGNGDMEVKSIISSSPAFKADSTSFTLKASQDTTINVTFCPNESKKYDEKLIITSTDQENKVMTVDLRGTGIAPEITVSPDSLDIGDVKIKDEGYGIFTIRNTGTYLLETRKMQINNPVFKISPDSLSIAKGQVDTVTVTFKPIKDGEEIGTITIPIDLLNKTVTVKVKGCGLAPEIDVFPRLIDIGDVLIDSTGTGDFTIENEGSLNLVVYSITSDSLAFTVKPDSLTLVPQKSETINVTFKPQKIGLQTSIITIFSNDPDEEIIKVSVKSNGVAPSISLTPSSLTMDTVHVGSKTSRSFFIKNVGTSDLFVSSIKSNNNVFKVPADTLIIAKGEVDTVTVTFEPTRRGYQEALIIIASNVINARTDTVRVGGLAVAPEIAVTPRNIRLGEPIEIGVSVSDSFTISNVGTADLKIFDIYSSNNDFTFLYYSEIIPPDSSQNVIVTFTPSSVGTHADTINVESNDPEKEEVNIPVLGEAFRYCSVFLLSSNGGDDGSDVIVYYNIDEKDSLEVSLTVMYSIDDGETWNTPTIKEAIGSEKNVIPGITKYNNFFTWIGKNDLPGREVNVKLEVTPNNGYADGKPDTINVFVNYKEPPSIEDVSLPIENAGEIEFTFKVYDAENDTVFVAIEYILVESGDRFIPTLTGYSLDGITYFEPEPSAVIPIYSPNDIDSVFIKWDAFKDIGYTYSKKVFFRLKPSDNQEGNTFNTDYFIVKNLLGDYNHNRVIDLNDFEIFKSAWEKQPQDLSKEIAPLKGIGTELGPARKTIPDWQVDPNNKIDFEDLMVFAWMFQWQVVYVENDYEMAKSVYKKSYMWEGIYLVDEGNGIWTVMCYERPDLICLLIENSKNTKVSVGNYWQNDENCIVLSRKYYDGSIEFAATSYGNVVKKTVKDSYSLALLNIDGDDTIENIHIYYRVLIQGEKEVKTGKIPLPKTIHSSIPTKFVLLQNTPNPFNPTTTIKYLLPRETHMKLLIYNMSGQVVTVLKSGYEKAGEYTVKWNAQNMPSGLYFYKLETDEYKETKKMLLLK